MTWRKRRSNRDFREEIAAHVALETARLVRGEGMSAEVWKRPRSNVSRTV